MLTFNPASVKFKIKNYVKEGPGGIPRLIRWKLQTGLAKPSPEVVYISEREGWVIHRIGKYLEREMQRADIPFSIQTSPLFRYHSIIHFGSIHLFNSHCYGLHPSNRIIVTFFHGDRAVSPEMDAMIDKFLDKSNLIDRIVVSNSIMMKRLISWGIDPKKIVQIPIGINTKAFDAANKKVEFRRKFGVDDDAVCIGSFQKDGNGFGEGLEPKLIKGPDLFLKVIEKLSARHRIHCMLSGPARGYVKKGLDSLGIPYTHKQFEDYSKVAKLYQCLDLYFVTSREEGGPKALMESMAAGVPLVTFRVGMAPDIIDNGENGFITEIGDVDEMVRIGDRILTDENLQKKLKSRGLAVVPRYDWSVIGLEYAKVYNDFMQLF